MKLVNEREIKLDNINTIEILYHSEEVALFKGDTDALVIKEYMNRDNVNFYAEITNSSNKLTIKRGNRLSFRLFYILRARVEVYIPALKTQDLTIKTTSGSIVAADEYICSQLNLASASGSISLNTITADRVTLNTTSGAIRGDKVIGNIAVNTTSGGITLGDVDGDVSAKSSSGGTKMNRVRGTITAETISGGIHCSTVENGGDISLASTSGGVYLGIPKNNSFTFSSRTTSGALSTPFSDKLFSPVSDRKSAQGTVGGENGQNITIKTTSGSIKAEWIQ